jgi:hypothetical protein
MDKVEELREYAKIEGAELGEAFDMLCSLDNLKDYLSPEFGKAIEEEITNQLNYMKKNSRIIIREYTQTNKYEELEWIER